MQLYVVLIDGPCVPDEENIQVEGVFDSPHKALTDVLEQLSSEDAVLEDHESADGEWNYFPTNDGGYVIGYCIEVMQLNVLVSELEEAVRMPTVGPMQ